MTAFSRRSAALALAALLALNCASPALAAGDDAVLRRMDSVLEENARLREEAWKARSHGKEAARQASEAYEASEARLEKTRTEALAHVAGVNPTQVEDMRRDGKSWGQAAEELGVHPGFLGIGKVPMYEPASVRRAARAEALKAKRKGAKSAKGVQAAQDSEPQPKGKGGKKSKEKPQAADKSKAKAKAEAAQAKKPKKKKSR